MKDPKKAEIKRALLGRAVLAEDGRLAVIPAGTFMRTPVGIGDGANAVRFLGIMRRVRRYETKGGEKKVKEAVLKSMQGIGRGLALSEQPEAIACLIRYILTRPAVLVFTYEDGVPTLTAWTGRGLTGWISLRRAIKAFEKGLPDTMVPIEVKTSKDTEAKRAEKERRKAEKEKRKAEKKRKKETRSAQDDQPREETASEDESKLREEISAMETVPEPQVPRDEADEI